mgnify:CR=1 FL=1
MIPDPRQAIIDIGSNSIRLVVFGGPPRAPAVLYNEKVMAGLGRGMVPGGSLDPEAVAVAIAGLERFAAVIALLPPVPVRVVATAAVREASDGSAFLSRVRALGLPAEILDGNAEGQASGYGVIAGAPEADGLVADMGGGSLELVRVCDGQVGDRTSLALGAMRVAEIRSRGPGKLRKKLRTLLSRLDWAGEAAGRPLYLVGGSWRALARVHMHLKQWPLPVLSNYTFPAEDARELKLAVRAMGTAQLLTIPGIKPNRVLQLDDAAALLAGLVSEIGPDRVVISSHGLREGLLYQALDSATRALDPLVEAVGHAVGSAQPHATETLMAWSDPAFAGEPAGVRRLRHAAYLLAETGWVSNPDFRVIEGEELALHGNWPAVDAAGRAQMAMALHVGLGGNQASPPNLVRQIASDPELARAAGWGHALRLAQRLVGNNPAALAALPLRRDEDGGVVLSLPRRFAALGDEATARRLARLGQALGVAARIETRA